MIELAPIPNCPDYLIDRNGSVYSTKNYRNPSRQPKLLKLGTAGTYKQWRAKDDSGKYRNYHAHILVLELFVGPRPTPQHHARHLNGDPLDNRLENLAWGTAKENYADSKRHGTNHLKSGIDNPRHRGRINRSIAIEIYKVRGKLSRSQAAKWFNVTINMVEDIWYENGWNAKELCNSIAQ